MAFRWALFRHQVTLLVRRISEIMIYLRTYGAMHLTNFVSRSWKLTVKQFCQYSAAGPICSGISQATRVSILIYNLIKVRPHS